MGSQTVCSRSLLPAMLLISTALWLLLATVCICNAAYSPHSEEAIKIALIGSFSSRGNPTDAEINTALNEFVTRNKGRVTVGSPVKMHTPWETDPLMANKVLVTVKGTYPEAYPGCDAVVANLTYDYTTSGYKFSVVTAHVWFSDANKGTPAPYMLSEDLKYLRPGWIKTDPGNTPEQTTSIHSPTSTGGGGEDDISWTVVIGGIGAVTAAAALAAAVKKSKKKPPPPPPAQKPSEKQKEKKERKIAYILQLSRDSIELTPEKTETLMVKAWRAENGQYSPAPEASLSIEMAPEIEGLLVSPRNARGELNLSISLQGSPAVSETSLTVRGSAGGGSTSATVSVKIRLSATMEFF